MKKIGYFCTAGYTEINGIKSFLYKINPNIIWERCLPPCGKPKPERTSRGDIIFLSGFSKDYEQYNGLTGQDLVDEMFRVIKDYGAEHDYDMYILIDDLDCRFDKEDDSIEDWIEKQRKRAYDILKLDIDFDVLFASPEVEGWFVSDWNNSFYKIYKVYSKDVPYKLLEYLKDDEYIAKHWDNIEEYGSDIKEYTEQYKLSKKIQDAFESEKLNEVFKRLSIKRCEYSKRIEGSMMLQQIDPQQVEKKCRLYFAPFYRKYSQLK